MPNEKRQAAGSTLHGVYSIYHYNYNTIEKWFQVRTKILLFRENVPQC